MLRERSAWFCARFLRAAGLRPKGWEYPCNRCGLPTAPKCGADEWYTVHDVIWSAAGASDNDVLCIGCLERALGRRLTHGDFVATPLNTPGNAEHSDRLNDRLNG